MNLILSAYFLLGAIVSGLCLSVSDEKLPVNRKVPVVIIMVVLWLPLIIYELIQGDYRDEI